MTGMQAGAAYVFWICAGLVAYTYFLYPVVLFLAYSLSQIRRDWQYLTSRKDRRPARHGKAELPSISLIIPAYNEEEHLPEKIASLRELDYPREKLDILFISDGSTDRTNELLGAIDDPIVQTILLSARGGKSNALNQAVSRAKGDILVFSDASTLLSPDALKKLVRHFADPRVGVVCGSLRFEGSDESKQTEGVYWKYETILRLMEARLGATLSASGAIYALRANCFRPLSAHTLIDDFVIPMNARKQGFEVLYDPEATAVEFAAASVEGEFTRRVRLAVGSFRALPEFARTPLRGFTLLAFVSHKLLRWVLPFLMIGMLISNGILLGSTLYVIAFAAQAMFYLWASVGLLWRSQLQRVPFGLVGYFLLAMNVAFLVGFVRFLNGRKEATWQRVQ